MTTLRIGCRMRAPALLPAAIVLVLAGCGTGPPPTAAPPTATVTVTSTTPTDVEDTIPVPTVAPPAVAPPVAATSWEMPDLVGVNLQDAQNAIQELTDYAIFLTTSSDASGADRSQILDSNWQVCSQNIAPGETITATSVIDFAAVKLGEDC